MADPEKSGTPELIANPRGEILALRFDVLPLLVSEIGPEWQKQLSDVIQAGPLVTREPQEHYTNREHGTVALLGLLTPDGSDLATQVPGLWRLYQGPFRELMERALPLEDRPLRAYDEPGLALEGLAQKPVVRPGSDSVQYRMENHVDQRNTAVLVVDAPPNDADGGRLFISNNPDALSVAETDADATIVSHRPGTLLCFSLGKIYPHHTEELTNPNSRRIIVSLNYPAHDESPEEAQGLQDYIQGKKASKS